jgi:hypothetical protein
MEKLSHSNIHVNYIMYIYQAQITDLKKGGYLITSACQRTRERLRSSTFVTFDVYQEQVINISYTENLSGTKTQYRLFAFIMACRFNGIYYEHSAAFRAVLYILWLLTTTHMCPVGSTIVS